MTAMLRHVPCTRMTIGFLFLSKFLVYNDSIPNFALSPSDTGRLAKTKIKGR